MIMVQLNPVAMAELRIELIERIDHHNQMPTDIRTIKCPENGVYISWEIFWFNVQIASD